MSVIVTDAGFAGDDWAARGALVSLEDALGSGLPAGDARPGLDLPNNADIDQIRGLLDRLGLIRIAFPSFADGRGFSLARRLREMGYAGRLRAAGHVIPDQYTFARRSGFDEIEISDEAATRQPEDQWSAQFDWAQSSYQDRLGRSSRPAGPAV